MYVVAREEIDPAEDLNTSLYSSLSRSSTVHRDDRGRVALLRERCSEPEARNRETCEK